MRRPEGFLGAAATPLDVEGAHRRLLDALRTPTKRCAHCGEIEGVQPEDPRTSYGSEDGLIPLCRPCAIAHHKHWDDLWKEYHNGVV